MDLQNEKCVMVIDENLPSGRSCPPQGPGGLLYSYRTIEPFIGQEAAAHCFPAAGVV